MSSLAIVSHVAPGSPAEAAGIEPGFAIAQADSCGMRDIIDWRWLSAENRVSLLVEDLDGNARTLMLERELGEEWGIEFDRALFDGTRQCCNACTFCFVRQLPQGMRKSLYVRDDDYRLSFLQGNFVTFSNLSEGDIERVIEQRLSPLRWSLHASNPNLRERLIGKRANYGLEVAQRLLDSGIELHAQIVLMPKVNDGEELARTLEWAYERQGILSVGIVPLGFTKHQNMFTESFDTPSKALSVIELVEPFRARALRERGHAWAYASDEFYRSAYPAELLDRLPCAESYGSFELFEDGIGIVRSFIDDFRSCAAKQLAAAEALSQCGANVLFVCGCAQKEFFAPLLKSSPCGELIRPLYVENEFFGGNVNVTGLLCACDIVSALKSETAKASPNDFAVISSVVFNADGVSLDGMTVDDMSEQAGFPIYMVSCQASEFLPEIAAIARRAKGEANA